MPSLIIATPKAADANAYLTEAEATAYLTNGRLHTETWVAASVSDREKAIIWATRMLDSLINWYGSIRTLTQALAWPRSGVSDRDWRYYDYDLIPTPIKQATAELAFLLLSKDRSLEPSLLGQGISQLTIPEVISLTITPSAVVPFISDSVMNMLLQLGELSMGVKTGGARVVRLERA